MVYCIFTRPLFIMNFLHKVYSKSHVWPVHSSFWSLLVALSILPFILPHFPLLDGPMIVYGSSLSPPFLNLFHLCQPPSFNLCLLLKLEKHITSLTGSWASFILCFCTMSFSVHPSTSPSLMFLSFSPFLFGMLHFVAPHLFYSLHFFFSYILPPPSSFSLHHRASPAHHYLSEHPAHCPSLLHFSSRTRNETGASFPLFIIFHPLFSLFVLHVVMLPPTHHPCRFPSNCWSEEGVKFCNSSHLVMFCGFFAERVTVGDLGVCAHGVWKTEKDRQLQWGVVFQAFCLFSTEQETGEGKNRK